MADLAERIARLTPEQRAAFEARLNELRAAATPSSIPRRQSSTPAPLSSAQLRLWFLDQLGPGNPVYNSSRLCRLTGELNIAALEQSIAGIVQRHESLRTTFVAVDGQPLQSVAPDGNVPLVVIDLSHRTQPAAAALAMADAAAVQPFSLQSGPLMRAFLYRTAPSEHLLLLCMHHIVTDAWSMSVLLHEVSTLYNAAVAGQPSPLPDLSIQYADYACWQRDWLDQHGQGPDLEFWRQHLDGAPALDLPGDRARPAVQSYTGVESRLDVPAFLVDRLRTIGRRQGCTLFMTMLGRLRHPRPALLTTG